MAAAAAVLPVCGGLCVVGELQAGTQGRSGRGQQRVQGGVAHTQVVERNKHPAYLLTAHRGKSQVDKRMERYVDAVCALCVEECTREIVSSNCPLLIWLAHLFK